MSGPLEGIRAIEWAGHANGPLIGVILGDLGADIIKLEQRGVGDPNRGLSSRYRTRQRLPTGIIAGFENTNRNKRSVSLDLKKERGREVAYRLVEKADVFYTNYGQPLARRLGVDYETLSKLNPRLIYADATGWGARGPDSEQRAFDTVAQARSGFMTSLGERNTPPSLMVGMPIDALGATIAALGILSALHARDEKGTGQKSTTSLLGSAIWVQLFNIQTALLRGQSREHMGMQRHLRTKPGNPLSNHYQCADGKWLLVGEGQFDRFWSKFCKVVSIEQPEYVKLKISDLQNRETMDQVVSFLDKVFATRSRDEWLNIFKQKNAEFAYAPVNEVSDLLNDVQVAANNYFTDFEHPVAGHIKYIGVPIELSKTPAKIKSAAPEFGAHTDEVLLESGYSREEIERLKKEEVI